MASTRLLRFVLPKPVRDFPVDLGLVLSAVVVTNIVIYAPIINRTPLRTIFGLALLLFGPGYAFIAASFPHAHDAIGDTRIEGGERVAAKPSVDHVERAVFSAGSSVALVTIIGVLVHFSPFYFGLSSVLTAISAVTVFFTCIAVIRRWKLPPNERFSIPYRRWFATGRALLFDERDARGEFAINVLLVVTVFLAVSTASFAILFPQSGERYSSVYVVAEDDDGQLVADGIPADIGSNASADLVVGVENYENREVSYTLVAVEEEVENGSAVGDQRELRRFDIELEHDESWRYRPDIEPTTSDRRARISWLLYVEDVPQDPTVDNADYRAHVVVNGSDRAAENTRST